MALLQIRNYPDDEYAILAKLAEREHRSIAQQTKLLIEHGLSLRETEPFKRRNEALKKLWTMDIPAGLSGIDAVAVIREDRER